MKKAIIVTFQNAYNYGAILQCFALQEKIKSLDISVSVLNYNNNIIAKIYKNFYIPSKRFPKCIKSFLSNIIYFKRIYIRNKNFKEFIDNNLNLTELMNYEEIKKLNLHDTVLIAGSDQIWNENITNGIDDIYFLNFGKNVKRISYAASIGKTDIRKENQKQVRELLEKFDYLSVREETGKTTLTKLINKKIDVVLDPTLLMARIEWDKYISKEKKYNEKYILVYMPNDIVIKVASNIAKKYNYKVINISKRKLFGKKEINKCNTNPLDFIQLIRDAECIVTSSFHAIVFSIIYNKNFWVAPPKGVSSRITDLLNNLKLNTRIIKSYDDFIRKDNKSKINFTYANEVLKEERLESLKRLKDNII